jgi:hypothetical protein
MIASLNPCCFLNSDRAGRGFIVRDLPWTVDKLRAIGFPLT